MSNSTMDDFLNIINNGLGRADARPVEKAYVEEDDGADHMKRILESFRGVSEDAVEEASRTIKSMTNPTVKFEDDYINTSGHTAPVVENFDHQAFEIRVRPVQNSSRKEYDIIERYSQKTVVERLVIREAADAIVKYLQKGYAINHKKIDEVLDFEEMYRRNRQDAVTFKQRYQTSTLKEEHTSAGVYESRFQVSKANAIMASDHIKSILENIR